MICPFCQNKETKVTDSRLISESSQVKRRRLCDHCKERFTTIETTYFLMPNVIKRDKRRVSFSKQKLHDGLKKALEKRPISTETIEQLVNQCLFKIRQRNEREISTEEIGSILMQSLKHVDKIAYIRFASVYWAFNDVDAYYQLLNALEEIKQPNTVNDE